MNSSKLLLALFAATALAACDRPNPTVVNVPAPTPEVVPGPVADSTAWATFATIEGSVASVRLRETV